MGAIQIGGQWFYLQPDGTRLGPFIDQQTAVSAGEGIPATPGSPAGGATTTTGGTGQPINPGTYDPANPIVGSSVPTAGGSLVYVGNTPAFAGDPVGQPKFQFVAGRTENPTVVVNGKLVDAVTGTVIADLSDPKTAGAVTPNTIYTQQQQNVRDQAALAEQKRQYNETFGANKARFNIEQTFEQQRQADALAEAERNRELSRGNTLLGLGSRPETLTRYLYALRGQQPAQGLGIPPALPGYANVAGVSSGAGPAAGVASGTSSPPPPAGRPAPSLQSPVAAPIQTDRGWRDPTTGALVPNQSGVFEQPGALPPGIRSALDAERARQAGPQAATTPIIESRAAPPITGVNPANLSSILQPVASSVQFAPSGQSFAGPSVSESDAQEQIKSREAYNAYQASIGGTAAKKLQYDPSLGRLYREGGVIPEPVMGMGMDSGEPYMLGEESHRGVREVVVPEDKVPKDIFERLMKDAEEVDYSESKDGKRHVKVKRGQMNSYQTGGVLGYKPLDSKVFNPPSISNTFDFPQIGNFTGGTSLVPSAQRLFEALPSERSLFSGYLQDEAGVQPDDVFALAQRLAPQASGLRTPRYVN